MALTSQHFPHCGTTDDGLLAWTLTVEYTESGVAQRSWAHTYTLDGCRIDQDDGDLRRQVEGFTADHVEEAPLS